MPDAIRWTVSVSRQTDVTVRSFLAQRGLKKGDLSRFIEEAVKWRVLDQTIAETRRQFADLPPRSSKPSSTKPWPRCARPGLRRIARCGWSSTPTS